MLLKMYSDFVFFVVTILLKSFYNLGSSNADKMTSFSATGHSGKIRYAILAEKFFNNMVKIVGNKRFAYIKKVNFASCEFFIRPFIFSDILMVSNLYEPYVKNILKVQDGDIFVDVGAHIGTYTVTVAKKVGDNGKVICFEPDPRSSSILERNVVLNRLKNVVVIKKAVVESEKKVLFSINENPAYSGIGKQGERELVVEGTDLDSALSEIGISKIDWLKIDVEGNEENVLKGASNTIKKYSPKIIIEAWEESLDKVRSSLVVEGYSLQHLFGSVYYATKN